MISRFLLDDFSNKVVVVGEAATDAKDEHMAKRLHPDPSVGKTRPKYSEAAAPTWSKARPAPTDSGDSRKKA